MAEKLERSKSRKAEKLKSREGEKLILVYYMSYHYDHVRYYIGNGLIYK